MSQPLSEDRYEGGPEGVHFSTVDFSTVHFSTAGDEAGLPAWTEIEEGRFLPRRVRGSCQGRALG